ncbi:Crp/Fnr family transcriptional regulator [Sphingomonas sp. BK580]|uniref:Crp/Fnr family transcriptional regulator n=1 Tax=Sphingomonas sp. BK580 TaxID=2586972 RepID=UPI00160BF52D|nr:Crp/Fnr family transcriptional regulator [Sphingomonas sp. BK580]MBB3693174.1 CRP-like cAMP-binding protein [Sphingomonas sp. BK580]
MTQEPELGRNVTAQAVIDGLTPPPQRAVTDGAREPEPFIRQRALERYLARLQLSSKLSSTEIEAVAGLDGEVKVVRAYRDITRLPGSDMNVTLVAKGMIGRFHLCPSGKRAITAVYMAGDIADLESAFLPAIRWSLTALTPATIVRIPYAQLRSVIVANPGLALAFWHDMAIEASVLEQWVINLACRSAEAKLVHLLCELGHRFERAGLGRRDDYVLPMIQAQIGDAIGLTDVHVNRMLGSLRRAGLIKPDGRRITIPSWSKVAAIGGFDPRYLHGLAAGASIN